MKALKGSLWIGLNKHTADNLYIISKHIRVSTNRQISKDLDSVFPEILCNDARTEVLLGDEERSKMYSSFISHPSENAIAKNVISLLLNIRQKADELACWSDEIATLLEDESVSIWNTWYQDGCRDRDGKHPFEQKIRQGGFLVSYEKTNNSDTLE